ncbi:hypothetical protein [Microcystis phage MaeS]|nr:hypothetical protein [Microcystis phage MaeS]
MEPINNLSYTRYRAILSNSGEVLEKGAELEVKVTQWVNFELDLEELKRKAKELGKDLITIETETTTHTSYEVK